MPDEAPPLPLWAIHKYEVTPNVLILQLPVNAEFLYVHTQRNKPQIWVRHTLSGDAPTARFQVTSRMTGELLKSYNIQQDGTYVGTAHDVDGWMVVHVYVRKLNAEE